MPLNVNHHQYCINYSLVKKKQLGCQLKYLHFSVDP